MGIRGIIVPRENAQEAAMVKAIDVIPVETLPDVIEFLHGRKRIEPVQVDRRNFSVSSMIIPLISMKYMDRIRRKEPWKSQRQEA